MDEGLHDDDRDDEATTKPTATAPKPTPLARPASSSRCLYELERGRAEHGRDGEEEAELGGGACGRRRAPCAPRIVAPERLTPGIIARHWTRPMPIDGARADISATPPTSVVLGQPLDQQDRDAADDQRTGDDHRHCRAAPRSGRSSSEAEDRRRAGRRPACCGRSATTLGSRWNRPVEHRPEGPPVEHDDREDRAELDDDVEQRPICRRRSRAARWRGSGGRSRRPAGIR